MSTNRNLVISEPGSDGDWTSGSAQLKFQRCLDCLHIRYFHRSFCPDCGSRRHTSQTSSGLGLVHATTLVHRASSAEFRAITPYLIVLADMDDGFRIMAHAQPDLTIGARVRCTIREVAGRLLPYAEIDNS